MKKQTAIWVVTLVVLSLMSGCSPSAPTAGKTVPESSVAVSKTPSQSSVQSSELNEVLPSGVERVSTNYLRYSHKNFGTVVTFSEQFNTLCEDYKPTNGIYLQTADGTATLLLEQVEDYKITAKELVENLKQDKKNKSIQTDKHGDVSYQTTITDKKKNEVTVFQKIRLSEDGYTAFTLCCRPNDTEQYQKIFESISLS